MPKKEEKLEEDTQETTEVAQELESAEVATEDATEDAVVEQVVSDESEVSVEPAAVSEEDIPEPIIGGESVSTGTENDGPVTVQPVQFASFEDLDHTQGEVNKNLDILMDIKLQMTVELGRTELPIRKVLELTRGSIIELEKIAGEPVELYANGKLVAHGEVVVIEDNFGLRITSITDPEDRLKGIGS